MPTLNSNRLWCVGNKVRVTKQGGSMPANVPSQSKTTWLLGTEGCSQEQEREHGEAGSSFAILMQVQRILSSPGGAPPHSLLQSAGFIRIAAKRVKEWDLVQSSRPPRSGNAVQPLCKGKFFLTGQRGSKHLYKYFTSCKK